MAKRDLTRVTVNLSTELVEKIDRYAEQSSLTRTSACASLLTQAINGQTAMDNLGDLLALLKSGQQAPETLAPSSEEKAASTP